MQCKRCGAEFSGNFCPNCGQAAEGARQDAVAASAQPLPQQIGKTAPPQAAGQGDPAESVRTAGQDGAEQPRDGQGAGQADRSDLSMTHIFISDRWAKSDLAAPKLIARIRTIRRIEFWGKLCCGVLVLIAVIVALVWGSKDPVSVLFAYEDTRAAVFALVWIAAAAWAVLTLLDAFCEPYVIKKCADWLRRQTADLGELLRSDLTELMAMQRCGISFGKEEKLRAEAVPIVELCMAPKRFAVIAATTFLSATYILFLAVLAALFLTCGLFDGYAEHILTGTEFGWGIMNFFGLFGLSEESGIQLLWFLLGLIGILIAYPLLMMLLVWLIGSVALRGTKTDKWLNEQCRLVGLKKLKKK